MSDTDRDFQMGAPVSTDIVERLFRLERSYPFTDVAHMLAEAGTEIRRLRSGRAAVIEDALRQAHAQFLYYERQHLAKEPPDTVKAQTNKNFADICERALTGGPRE